MSPIDNIPLVDLHAQYLSIKKEIDKAVSDCINDAVFIKGKLVSDFEKAFASYIGTSYCVSCGNGTDALELILKALGIGPGDEVIVPALTWIATAEAVTNVGAEPVFADILEKNFTIDPASAESVITKRTKAIIAVHLYGSPCEMNELQAITERHNLYLVEDCAQSHGAEYRGIKTGRFGVASAFSFFPSKNLGAFGDAGAIVTNDENIAARSKMIANHGQLERRHQHTVAGRNSRLDTIQASVLLAKLPHLESWNDKRRSAALKYIELLSDCSELSLPVFQEERKNVFHLFVIRSERRDELILNFEANQIGCGIHYPKPLPFVDAYKYKDHTPENFPVATAVTKKILSIPIYPEISDSQIERVSNTIHRFF